MEYFYLEKYAIINELKNNFDKYIRYYNHDSISLWLKGLGPVEYQTQALKIA
ncbi:IS3 family transposase [Raoultella ornithinolytica]|uniref:IS3 family transposase n=1 Tax=Raoultella ornithinolytica TaxID=54291 RepID=UPI003D982A27